MPMLYSRILVCIRSPDSSSALSHVNVEELVQKALEVLGTRTLSCQAAQLELENTENLAVATGSSALCCSAFGSGTGGTFEATARFLQGARRRLVCQSICQGKGYSPPRYEKLLALVNIQALRKVGVICSNPVRSVECSFGQTQHGSHLTPKSRNQGTNRFKITS